MVLFLRVRRPPSSTRTAALFPDSTLCRSSSGARGRSLRLCPHARARRGVGNARRRRRRLCRRPHRQTSRGTAEGAEKRQAALLRSEEHTSELQSIMRHSYAVFCLEKKTAKTTSHKTTLITKRKQTIL